MKTIKLKHILSFVFMFLISLSCLSLMGCSKDSKIDLDNDKILVTYFSATGSTRNVAQVIKDYLNCDIAEIVPTQEYTSSDLNWNNSQSRVNAEHNARVNNDTNSQYYRPAFNFNIDDLSQYDTIFIGYPIWWGEAPNIIYNFLEQNSNNFENKTIIPFCTSASSGLGQSATHLHSCTTSTANWYSGQRFSSNVSKSTIENWVEQLKK